MFITIIQWDRFYDIKNRYYPMVSCFVFLFDIPMLSESEEKIKYQVKVGNTV